MLVDVWGMKKKTSVGEIGEMYDSAKCMWWVKEKKWKVWVCQQVSKKYVSTKEKKRKEKCINTTKIRVDIMLERKRKKLKRIDVKQTLGFSRK